jgi:hypothetical protein
MAGSSGRVGEWESGRVGEWESGRVGEWVKNPAVSPTFPLAHDLLMLIRENQAEGLKGSRLQIVFPRKLFILVPNCGCTRP